MSFIYNNCNATQDTFFPTFCGKKFLSLAGSLLIIEKKIAPQKQKLTGSSATQHVIAWTDFTSWHLHDCFYIRVLCHSLLNVWGNALRCLLWSWDLKCEVNIDVILFAWIKLIGNGSVCFSNAEFQKTLSSGWFLVAENSPAWFSVSLLLYRHHSLLL